MFENKPVNHSAAAELAGVVIAVFGAGSRGDGLSNGQAAAITFARAGATVACVDVDGDAADMVTQRIRDEGGTALSVQADFTTGSDVIRAYARIAAAWEPPLGVHNNVGVAVTGAIIELEPSGWDRAMAVERDQLLLDAAACPPAHGRPKEGVYCQRVFHRQRPRRRVSLPGI